MGKAPPRQKARLVASGPILPDPPGPLPSSILVHSARTIEKATLVAIENPPEAGTQSIVQSGNALAKFSFLRRLTLQPGEVLAARQYLASEPRFRGGPFSQGQVTAQQAAALSPASPLWGLLTSFEGNPPPMSLPSPASLSEVPLTALKTFGDTVATIRKVNAAGSPSTLVVKKVVSGAQQPDSQAGTMVLLRAATIANKSLAVAQKEWSVTSKEFTSIVTDSLENYSETGVTDNTELAQATTSQLQHSNQFNITGTVSGGIPIISGSVTSGFTAQDASSQTATDSRKHATSMTQKASSRSKQEHKVTISTTTVTGTSESTTRTLKNSSQTDPIRIDYFSMMREWRVRLYRYGLRLTYDLVIPEPAGLFRQTYAYLEWLRSQIGPFTFNISRSEIDPNTRQGENEPHYLVLADRYGAQVPPPPDPNPSPLTPSATPPAGNGWSFSSLSFEVPTDYEIKDVHLFADIGALANAGDILVYVEDSGYHNQVATPGGQFDVDLTAQYGFLKGATGSQKVNFRFVDAGPVYIGLVVSIEPTSSAMQRWGNDVWNALYNAAQTQYYAQQQDIAARISQLEDRLNKVDTLTLRREESEEIMKIAVATLTGNWMGSAWADLSTIAANANVNNLAVLFSGAAFIGDASGLNYSELTAAMPDEDVIRFINQAIEWESVVTFLYSYFWDIPASWSFIRNIQHPDATRQAFLRAGSARVVLTVRKGWEEKWVNFVDTGDPYSGGGQYLSIAQEIAAYDDRNYPGIPPANPGQSAVRPEDSIFLAGIGSAVPNQGNPRAPVTITVDSSKDVVVGLPFVGVF